MTTENPQLELIAAGLARTAALAVDLLQIARARSTAANWLAVGELFSAMESEAI